MTLAETTIWVLMAGGLLSLSLMTLLDTLTERSIGAVRNLMYVLIIDIQCVLLSGLSDLWLSHMPAQWLLALQVAISPFSSAAGLRMLGIWLGESKAGYRTYAFTVWGSHALVIAAIGLLAAGLSLPMGSRNDLLLLSGTVAALPALPAMLIALLAHKQGDRLSRWMAMACVLYGLTTMGLLMHALDAPGAGLLTWALTGVCVLLFLLTTMTLVVMRNRSNRRLARLARLDTGTDPATGLPTGSQLLADVEQAFWRAGRQNDKCVVVCIYLSNLYELAEPMGPTTDSQILAATAARIHRAVGFRCVIGVYHPRCFIIVFNGPRERVLDRAVIDHIRELVTKPLRVVGYHDQHQEFEPRVGMSVQTVLPDHAVALEVINRAERRAITALPQQEKDTTTPSHLESLW